MSRRTPRRREAIECSPVAVRCLDHLLGEALDLAVSCRVLSDGCRTAGDALTAVALERLSAELMDQAAILAPLVRSQPHLETPLPPSPAPPGGETCLADLDHRLCHTGLVAESDAMSQDLEPTVVGLLWSLAALYRTQRELLLVCTLLDSA